MFKKNITSGHCNVCDTGQYIHDIVNQEACSISVYILVQQLTSRGLMPKYDFQRIINI